MQMKLNFYPTPLEMAEEFATSMEQVPNADLSASLVLEEMDERIEELGVNAGNNEAELKELADLVYVIYGYANVKGWDLDEAVYRIHSSNMSKLDDEGKPIKRDDGKVLKGPNYKEPNLEDLV